MTAAARSAMPRRTFDAGAVIFQEGEEASSVYLVQDGEVEIVRNVGGRKVTMFRIQNGGVLGEISVVAGKPYMADAVTSRPTTCIVISRDQFHRKLAAADPFVKALLRIVVAKARDGDELHRAGRISIQV
jgi:CRP-like cAMP-binding protein